MVKIIRLVVIDFVLLHILSLVTAPIITIVILGAGAIFTYQQITEIKEAKAKKEAKKSED